MTKTSSQTAAQTNRHGARRDRDVQLLRTLTGRVRATHLTPDGHAACVFDTPAGRLRALSDAAVVHLPELRHDRRVQVVLLKLRRETSYGCWDWQLLACQGLAEDDAVAKSTTDEGSCA